MIALELEGSFDDLIGWAEKLKSGTFMNKATALAQRGEEALAAATPLASGKTASSWGHEITRKGSTVTITWTNNHIVDGVPIAIILQHGHATGTGGYVPGRDYINPAIGPVVEQMTNAVWREVLNK